MNRVRYIPIAIAVAIIHLLPLTIVAIVGRLMGQMVWWVDWRRRRVALVNLDIAFGKEKSRDERTAIARENFRRLGEAFLCALKTTGMRREELVSRLQIVGIPKIQPWLDDADVPGVVIAMGHFGNIEMYGEAARTLSWVQPLTVYRKPRTGAVDKLLADVRRASPVTFFDEGSEMRELRETIRARNVVLGLMCDYNPGPGGLSVLFFGQPVATPTAPLVHARRFGMPLFCAVCFRTGLGRWRVEISDQIATRHEGGPRPAVDILGDINSYFEVSIRRDPANWCWVHKRWEHLGQNPILKVKSNNER